MKNTVIKPVSDFAEVITGGTPSTTKPEYWDGDIPWLNSGVLNEGYITTPSKYITARGLKNSSAKLMPKDTVLIALTGATTGQVGYLSFEAAANQSVTGILPSKEHYPRYLYYFLKSQRSKIQSDTFGGAQPHINQKYVKDFNIPLPPLDEQICIATLLSKVENLISRRREQLKQLDELLKSVFLEMFGDPVRNEKGWDKPELKQFGQILTGNTPPRIDASNYVTKHIEWIKTDNIFSDSLYITQATEYLSESGLTKSRKVTKGALLVACIAGSVASIGRAALTNRTVSFNQQINAIQSNKDINPFFLYVLFKISKTYVQSHATKGMKKILTKGDFEKITMIKPPIDLQNQFAEIVEMVEGIKSRYQQSLIEFENLYRVLSQKAFKGELDLLRVPLEKNEELMHEHMTRPVPKGEESANTINLPDPDDASDLGKSELRKDLIEKWLDAYIVQLGSDSKFVLADFVEAAHQKLSSLLEDEESSRFGPREYDQIKDLVFKAIEQERISQTRNIVSDPGKEVVYGNQIILTKVNQE